MRQGKTEKEIIRQCLSEGRELPKAIRNAPTLLPGLQMYLIAFNRLDTCRSASFGGVGHIPWMTVMDYCDRLGINDPEQRADMEYHINALDVEYQKWAEEKRKK